MKFRKAVSLLVLTSMLASMCTISYAVDVEQDIIAGGDLYDFSDEQIPSLIKYDENKGTMSIVDGVLKYTAKEDLAKYDVGFSLDFSGFSTQETGILTYEFDWKMDSGKQSGIFYDWGNMSKPKYAFMCLYADGFISGGYQITNQKQDGWNHYSIVINFDKKEMLLTCNSDAKKERTDGFTNANFYTEGVNVFQIDFTSYESGTQLLKKDESWYIDNIRVTHERTPRILSEVKVAGVSLEGLEQDIFSYELDLYADVLTNVTSDSVIVELVPGFADAKVTKTVTDEGKNKKITITVKKDAYNYTYTVLCKKIVEVMTVDITECKLEKNVLQFAGNVRSDRGASATDIIVDTYRSTDSAPAVGESSNTVTVSSDDTGKFKGSIILDATGDAPELYTLNVRFFTNEDTTPTVRTVQYANDAQYGQSIADLKSSDKTVFAFMTSASEDGSITAEQNEILFETLGIWLDEYNSLVDEADKTSVNNKVEIHRSGLTNENIYKIVNGSLAAVMLPKITTSKGAKMLAEYDGSTNTLVVGGTHFSKLDSTSQEWIVSNAVSNIPQAVAGTRAAASDEFADYETMIREVRKSMLLDLVDTTPYVNLSGLILNNTDLIDDTNGSLVKLQGMTDDEEIEEVMTNVKLANEASKFTTTNALISKVGSEIDDLPDGNEGGGGSSGGGSSGGGGGGDGFSIQAGATAPNIPTVPDKPVNQVPQEEKENFNDMNDYDWAKEAVNYLYKEGIVSGTGEGSFSPERNVTREEFVKLICEAFGFEKSNKTLNFTDTVLGEWYYPYVAGGVDMEIVNGISTEIFGIGRNITREDMSVIIARALEAKEINIAVGNFEFADSDVIADYAKNAVAALAADKVINGVDGNRFSPKSYATRAEAAVMIYRCINKYFK